MIYFNYAPRYKVWSGTTADGLCRIIDRQTGDYLLGEWSPDVVWSVVDKLNAHHRSGNTRKMGRGKRTTVSPDADASTDNSTDNSTDANTDGGDQ